MKDQGQAELSPATSRSVARATLAALFGRVGLAGADLDARVLVCAACGIDHAELIRDPDLPLGPAAETLMSLVARRVARVPVSRLIGRREFWGLPFAIGPDVLDPRPETEGVVGAALDAIGGRRDSPLRILDLGTGAGAILCALLLELPGAYGIGVDRSPAACGVARANIAAFGLAGRAAVLCGSWADAIAGRFDIVVSNPPYIARGAIAALDPEVREHDPELALDGGLDGLDAYRVIARQLPLLLRPGGVAALECGHDQGGDIVELVEAALADASVLKDLAGLDRVVVATAPDGARRATSAGRSTVS